MTWTRFSLYSALISCGSFVMILAYSEALAPHIPVLPIIKALMVIGPLSIGVFVTVVSYRFYRFLMIKGYAALYRNAEKKVNRPVQASLDSSGSTSKGFGATAAAAGAGFMAASVFNEDEPNQTPFHDDGGIGTMGSAFDDGLTSSPVPGEIQYDIENGTNFSHTINEPIHDHGIDSMDSMDTFDSGIGGIDAFDDGIGGNDIFEDSFSSGFDDIGGGMDDSLF